MVMMDDGDDIADDDQDRNVKKEIHYNRHIFFTAEYIHPRSYTRVITRCHEYLQFYSWEFWSSYIAHPALQALWRMV
jgi:hypothetical protein